ncbi:hypothetical protein L218DRAFT_474203 [Marasmius fiardii PR-910]|nr:hypothetical protein L218DRAFT_474203 [Marasmius fiardii PR-910]
MSVNTNHSTLVFVDVILESGLYGISLILFMSTLKELFLMSCNRWNMVILTLAFFILSTLGFTTDIYNVITTSKIIISSPTLTPAMAWYLAPHVSKILGFFAYTAAALLADGVVLFRCYRLCRSKKVLILPGILWLGLLVSSVGNLVISASFKLPTQEQRSLQRIWFTIFLSLSLSTNLIGTGLLAYAICSIDAAGRPHRSRLFSPAATTVLRVVVESGLIYSVFLVTAIVSCVFKSSTQKIFTSLAVSMVPITFYLIIIRLGRARREDNIASSSSIIFTSAGPIENFTTTSRSGRFSVATVSSNAKVVAVQVSENGQSLFSIPPSRSHGQELRAATVAPCSTHVDSGEFYADSAGLYRDGLS